MTFIAGAYTATYNGLNLGTTEDGFDLESAQRGDPIIGDNFGDVIQDYVFRGVDGIFCDVVLLEDDLAMASQIFWDLNPTWGVIFPSGGPSNFGKLASTLSSPLVLTKIAGPNSVPQSITAMQSILAPGFPVRRKYANRLRRIPLRIHWMPYPSAGTTRFCSFTS